MRFSFVLSLMLISLVSTTASALIPIPESSHLRLKLQVEDPNFVLPNSQKSLLVENIQAAFRQWAQHFESSAEVTGLIKITNVTKSQRIDCASTSNIKVGKREGFSLAEESAAYKIRTGNSARPEMPDLLIQIDPQYFFTDLWLDPNPELRTASIPDKKIDAVSVFIHEFGHAFGLQSFRDKKSGTSVHEWQTLFDQFVTVGPKGFEYRSPTLKLNLTSGSSTQNITHFADEKSDDHANDVMNGLGFRYKTRYEVSPTVLAVMKDLGLPIN